jgi:hypothetical protein
MRDDRSWMYDGWTSNGMPTREWMVNTQAFVDHIFSLSPGGGLAKYSCNKCQNCSRQVKIDMERHLCNFGFMPNYERWYEHGESQEYEPYNLVDSFEENEDRMDAMMDDFVQQIENAAEVPEYFGMLALSKEPLYGGHYFITAFCCDTVNGYKVQV